MGFLPAKDMSGYGPAGRGAIIPERIPPLTQPLTPRKEFLYHPFLYLKSIICRFYWEEWTSWCIDCAFPIWKSIIGWFSNRKWRSWAIYCPCPIWKSTKERFSNRKWTPWKSYAAWTTKNPILSTQRLLGGRDPISSTQRLPRRRDPIFSTQRLLGGRDPILFAQRC